MIVNVIVLLFLFCLFCFDLIWLYLVLTSWTVLMRSFQHTHTHTHTHTRTRTHTHTHKHARTHARMDAYVHIYKQTQINVKPNELMTNACIIKMYAFCPFIGVRVTVKGIRWHADLVAVKGSIPTIRKRLEALILLWLFEFGRSGQLDGMFLDFGNIQRELIALDRHHT